MSQAVPFAESTGGKLANSSAAIFFTAMAVTGMQAAPKEFSLLFIGAATLAICGFINAVALSLEDYPKESLLMVVLGPILAGPLLAWTHIAGGGEQWKPMVCAFVAVVFVFFVVKPPKWRI